MIILKRDINLFITIYRLFFKPTFIMAGKLVGSICPINNSSGLFFFFSNYCQGEQRVHAEIVETVKDIYPWVVFERGLPDKSLKYLFEPNCKMIDLTMPINIFGPLNFISRSFFAGFISSIINKHRNARVFCCNPNLGYDVISGLNKNVKIYDLIHTFNSQDHIRSLSVTKKITQRIVIDHNTLNNFDEFYKQNNINSEYLDRINLIFNKVDVPDIFVDKEDKEYINALYIGRNDYAQKRPQLLLKVAEKCLEQNIPVKFTFISDINEKEINPILKANCSFLGAVSDKIKIETLIKSDTFLLASAWEGFPKVIMEAMAYGIVVITTDVGGITYYVKDQENGLLIKNIDEDYIVDTMTEKLKMIIENKELRQKISLNAYNYAKNILQVKILKKATGSYCYSKRT